MNSARRLLQTQYFRCLAAAPNYRASVQHVVFAHPPRRTSLSQLQWPRSFHGSPGCSQNRPVTTAVGQGGEKKEKSLVTYDELFEQVARDAKSKATFNRVVDIFSKRDVRRRGHVEFIYAALKKMPEFGVERDIAVYNKLLDVFPKEVLVARNFIQRMFNHYPRQQECGVQVLEQMENYGIMPNVETKVLLVQIFGDKSHPVRKYQRLMYWFPKFKHANPFPVPRDLPQDPVDLARLSLGRIANDLDSTTTVYQMPSTDLSETGEEISLPHIVGTQSPDQRSLLAKHNPSRPVFVEGPLPLWLRGTCVYYYVLRADPPPPEEKVEEPCDPELFGPGQSIFYPLVVDLALDRDLGDDYSFDVDDVEEGVVYAMCMTGQGDQATLGRWISGLQETNPILGQIPTLFRLESGPRELQGASETPRGPDIEAEPRTMEHEPFPEEEHQHSQGMKQ
ncbi:evolutionarily conserved signaling intermediate in Toll pathway, mitochondrial [Denticeps clupeoides]|uniref:Evolutionarily conserved signaling intermediate in Toll pathway, mitochondrial n=1 Tax=Denticeps clupeoides TaxID=299321 RepID=A0AAY4A3N2_9TELE|nr:evolutionarily conserved signaling intermediate in Toll pathway, mitochondrial [Denticeps clupeoides]